MNAKLKIKRLSLGKRFAFIESRFNKQVEDNFNEKDLCYLISKLIESSNTVDSIENCVRARIKGFAWHE